MKLFIILVMFICCGCSNYVSDPDYQLSFETFYIQDEDKHTDILIQYPQIKNMKSLELEMKVNKLLKEKAISVYEDEDVEGLELPMKTSVEYFNSSLISVKYSGYEYYYGAVNGSDIMYATNINLVTGELIDIRDLFTDGFQQKLNRNVFEFNGVGTTSEGETIDPNSHEYGYVNGEESVISEMFNNYYSNLEIDKYYFSENQFNIIVGTPSGPTIYLELATHYENLKDCMNDIAGFWNDILKLN